MPREKHGQYDEAKSLPDNTGQPQGSGLIVWFHEQICERLGEEAGQALIAESRAHDGAKVAWLCAQLKKRGETELVEAYEQQRREIAALSRMRDKERIIHRCEETLARNDTPPEHQLFLRKQIAKAQAYLDARRGPETEQK